MRVNLEALVANYAALVVRCGRASAVVKADAYGLGLEPVAHALVAAGCREFSVANTAEGLSLRDSLRSSVGRSVDRSVDRRLRDDLDRVRIVVLGGPDDAIAAQASAAAGLEPVLNDPRQAELWLPYRDQPAVVHIDTGMRRLGFTADQLDAVPWHDYRLAYVMTHLACADLPEHPANERQLREFDVLRRKLPELPTSIANSAGCLLPERFHGDLVRPGIGLYGGHPRNLSENNPMQPVVAFEGRIVSLRDVPAGVAVGYGGTHIAAGPRRIAVVGLGYADGLPRILSNRGAASLAGRRAPIVGRVSMDLVHLDITELAGPAPQIGDWAQFWGADIAVDEVAQWAETIALELLCSLSRRPAWDYVGGG